MNEVVRIVIAAAKSGDVVAARLVIDKLVPAVRERAMSIDLPAINGVADCSAAQAKVLAAVAGGDLLPAEGQALAGLIDQQRRSLETTDLAQRWIRLNSS
ncbi:MAG: hypothetical protein IPP03_22575 [Dechloromonas sp.]|nr:hypothetical protein [Candidatus Dechloromonas phosphoritropha]